MLGMNELLGFRIDDNSHCRRVCGDLPRPELGMVRPEPRSWLIEVTCSGVIVVLESWGFIARLGLREFLGGKYRMAKGMPSLLASLGFGGRRRSSRPRQAPADDRRRSGGRSGATTGSPERHVLVAYRREVGHMFGSGNSGRNLSESLSTLVGRFRDTGQGATADSLGIKGGQPGVAAGRTRKGYWHDTLAELLQTVLSRAEAPKRLTVALPETVNRQPPDGWLPRGRSAALNLILV